MSSFDQMMKDKRTFFKKLVYFEYSITIYHKLTCCISFLGGEIYI